MSSTFFGLEIGRRALAANQVALDVIGQNTSNVGTAGYSRQVANFEESDPYGYPGADTGKPAQLGTGVSIASIDRVRDDYLDKRIYAANADQGALNSLNTILSRAETAYGEPSDTAIGGQLSGLFNSFSDLSASPESDAVRSTVLNKAQGLVDAFHEVTDALAKIAPDIQANIVSKVGTANNLAQQIAALNKQIALSVDNADRPNDLLDRRTALIGQLSGLVDLQVIDSKNPQTNLPTGEVQIDVGGFTLVRGDAASSLPSQFTSVNGKLGLVTSNGLPIPLKSGEIAGLIQANSQLNGYRADLDTLALNTINAVNAQHKAGVGLDGATGRSFFTGTGAEDIQISPDVANDPDAIAAAAAPLPPATVALGNGDNARSLAALSSKPVIGGFSLDQFYNAKVAGVGADSQRAQGQSDNQTKVVSQLQSQQASISGVNLDEELTKMLQYQRSYQAAARIVNVQDGVLNTIINGLGATAATA